MGDSIRQQLLDSIEATDTAGKAHWVATYTFSGTGRKVVNDIQASFVFKVGKIVRHKDVFDLYLWARHALGLKGVLLGWTPLVQGPFGNRPPPRWRRSTASR